MRLYREQQTGKNLKDIFGKPITPGSIVMYPSGKRTVMAIGVATGMSWNERLRLITPYQRVVQKYVYPLGFIELGTITNFTSIYLERLDRLVVVDPSTLDKKEKGIYELIELSERLINQYGVKKDAPKVLETACPKFNF